MDESYVVVPAVKKKIDLLTEERVRLIVECRQIERRIFLVESQMEVLREIQLQPTNERVEQCQKTVGL